MLVEWMVDRAAWGSCPFVGFDITCVQSFGFWAR